MVLMSAGKMSRNAGSIVNRTNICGGVKKAGLASSIGAKTSLPNYYMQTVKKMPLVCTSNFVPYQRRRFSAIHSMM